LIVNKNYTNTIQDYPATFLYLLIYRCSSIFYFRSPTIFWLASFSCLL